MIDAEKLKAEIKKRINELDSDKYLSVDSKTARIAELHFIDRSIDSLQQKPQEEICPKCIHHRKDDDCYYPYGGMHRRINENGVYECTGFCEKEQEYPNVDLEKELDKFYGMYRKGGQTYDIKDGEKCADWKEMCNPDFEIALVRHFYELGRKGGSK